MRGEAWTVRFEDIDTLRSKPGAKESQLLDFERLGMSPSFMYDQSTRYPLHLEAFESAKREGIVYPCDCSRTDVLKALREAQSAPHSHESYHYSGQCRHNRRIALSEFHPKETLAWRWARADDSSGRSDAIIARTKPDGSGFAPAYHWACAIDDADGFNGPFSLLVRAWDLAPADEVQRPIRIWRNPDSKATTVFHTALVTLDSGERLEKRTQRVTLDEMLSLGYKPVDIVEAFAKSFAPTRAIAESGVSQSAPLLSQSEAIKTLKLSSLFPRL